MSTKAVKQTAHERAAHLRGDVRLGRIVFDARESVV